MALCQRDSTGRDEVIRTAREHGFPDERIDHSVEVADLALQISDIMIDDGLEVDRDIVDKGALLHDIGYLRLTGGPVEIPEWKSYGIKIPSDDINHPMLGAIIVEEWGFSGEVADCVLRHNIGGFTVSECRSLKVDPIPEKDCNPVKIEEKLVHYADHLMLLKRLGMDPLKDPQATARACFPWLKYMFMERAGMKIGIDHPTVQREVTLSNELKKYLKPSLAK